MRDARLIHTLRRSHYLFPQIRPVLEGLRRTALTARTTAMLEGAGALHAYLTSSS